MVKSDEEINKIVKILLEQYDLKEELDSLTNYIVKPENGLFYLSNSEVVSREEFNKRTERKVEILQFVLEKAEKCVLIEGEITLTKPEAK